MNKKREYLHYHHHIEIIAIIVVIGLFFIGGGITGLHMFDFKQGFCDDNSDCESTELCCFFYEESHGICGKQIECSGIERLTKEEKQSRTNFEQPKQEVGLTVSDKLSIEHPSETAENYFLIVFGALVLIGIIVYIVYHKYFKGKKQHTMIKRKKSKILVTGVAGFIGSSIVKKLKHHD